VIREIRVFQIEAFLRRADGRPQNNPNNPISPHYPIIANNPNNPTNPHYPNIAKNPNSPNIANNQGFGAGP
jgi:hypothetical protein